MNRDDLRVKVQEETGKHRMRMFRPVSDAELAEIGLVVVPDCEACDGEPFDTLAAAHYYADREEYTTRCPSCGGSGKGRLVNLTGIDVGELRRWMVTLDGRYWDELSVTEQRLRHLGHILLAALDKGEAE